MNDEVLFLTPTAIQKRAALLSAALPGVILIIEAISKMGGDEEVRVLYPALNFAAGAGVMAAAVYETRRSAGFSRKRLSLVDVFSGIILIVIGINKLHPGKLFQPGVLYMFTGVFVIAKGIFLGGESNRRRITFGEDELTVRMSRFSKFRIAWKELASIRREGDRIVFTRAAGTEEKLDLRRAENKKEALDKLLEHSAKHGLAIETL